VRKNDRRVRRAVLRGFSCAALGSVGYAIGGPALAMAGLVVVTVLGVALAVILMAMLGHGESRSPFERLVVVLCILTGRRPRDYLLPMTAQRPPTGGSEETAPAAVVLRVTTAPSASSSNGS